MSSTHLRCSVQQQHIRTALMSSTHLRWTVHVPCVQLQSGLMSLSRIWPVNALAIPGIVFACVMCPAAPFSPIATVNLYSIFCSR
jgi:hypothetical protein